MFIYERAFAGQVVGAAGVHHGAGEGGGFGGAHAAEEDGHEEGGCLVVWDLAADVTLDEGLDGGGGQGVAVAFGADDFGG